MGLLEDVVAELAELIKITKDNNQVQKLVVQEIHQQHHLHKEMMEEMEAHFLIHKDHHKVCLAEAAEELAKLGEMQDHQAVLVQIVLVDKEFNLQ